MKTVLRLVRAPTVADPTSGVLRRIAATLNVPVDALSAHRETHVLHTAADGAAWDLFCDAQGDPVVRHIGNVEDRSPITVESVPNFLARDTDSPQSRALATLINQLLAVHLAS